MSDEELKLILKEFETVRVEMLDDNAKRLFYAIMKIADERDDLQKENQRLNDDIKILLKENEAKEKVIIKYDNVLNELRENAITFINIFQDEKTLTLNYNDLKHLRGIINGEEFDIRILKDKLNELKESDKQMNNWKEKINFNEEKFRQDTDTIELQDIEIVEEAIQTLKQIYFSKEDGFRRVEKISLLAINLLMKQLEAYENMRKEVLSEIEYFELQAQHLNDDIYLDEKLTQKLKDILNKVGGRDE